MSQENVELVRASIQAIRARMSAGDMEGALTEMAKLWDPAIEWDASEVRVPGLSGVYHGTEEVREFWREWLAAWETLDFEYELLDAGDRVVILFEQRMRGSSTGIEVPQSSYAQVATFRNGREVHWKLYLSQAEALEAAGLRE